jgi:rhodanese-related sulfurtransferase
LPIIDSRFSHVYSNGHIPSSINVPFTQVLNEDKTYKSAEELTQILKQAGFSDPVNQQYVLSCQRGVTACILDVAMRLIGNTHTSVYDGSYEEYSKKFRVDLIGDGTGKKVPLGATVLVHYTGRLPDGTKFDSSLDRGKPFKFVVGIGRVIRGWDEGIIKMKKGQKAVITCPPDYAYGP